MTKTEQDVRISFREDYKQYEHYYPSVNGTPTTRACAKALDFADNLWHLREVEQEIQDIKAGVFLSHYEDWVISELKNLTSIEVS